jgi:hypothetical protein
MGHWPPLFFGWIGPAGPLPPVGEAGVLKAVRRTPKPGHLSLEVEYEGDTWSGGFTLEDLALCARVYELLQQNLGRSLREIGDLELDE